MPYFLVFFFLVVIVGQRGVDRTLAVRAGKEIDVHEAGRPGKALPVSAVNCTTIDVVCAWPVFDVFGDAETGETGLATPLKLNANLQCSTTCSTTTGV